MNLNYYFVMLRCVCVFFLALFHNSITRTVNFCHHSNSSDCYVIVNKIQLNPKNFAFLPEFYQQTLICL